MPVVVNQRNQGSNKPDEKKPLVRIQPVTAGGVLSDVKLVVAIIAGVVLLLVGLVGWSQGWFGGTATVPANASAKALVNAIAPPGGGDADKTMGNKRNKGMGE